MKLGQLRGMHKAYGELRHYAALDGKAPREDVKRYRAWRRAWRDVIMSHIKRVDIEGHKRRRERRKAERKQIETVIQRSWKQRHKYMFASKSLRGGN